ncbi:hypothetical protein ATN88_19025 [Enterovibrio coralii]|uniref:Flagella basal body P-ring formation protein FlgA n=2 Tax=Enterovibrio coralii TaxID=294935 RepID=A0A135I6I4_9GAMM|nr:hypothetical protein ATN88_19025 [Enterovibrio coralii]
MLSMLFIPPLVSAESVEKVDENAFRSWLLEAHKQEVAEVAQSHNWPDYSLDSTIRVPASVGHLPVCKMPLNTEGRDHQSLPIGNLKRAVSCSDKNSSWRINVAIKSAITLPVVFLNKSLQRGDEITPSALTIKKHTLSKGYPFFTNKEDAIGLRTIRRLRSGNVLNASHLESVPLVMKGNEVLLVASKGDFQASMKGVALEEGKKGEQIDVRNLSSNKVVRAVVTGKNTVKTQF